MLEKYKNPYAVELKGERSLVTASYDAVKTYGRYRPGRVNEIA